MHFVATHGLGFVLSMLQITSALRVRSLQSHASTPCLNLNEFYANLNHSVPWKVFSQFYQDSRLAALYDRIGVTNKFFVEFGAPQSDEALQGTDIDPQVWNTDSMSNTNYLKIVKGWNGLLMDGGFEKPAINIHKEWITKDNVVSLFEKHAVPQEADLVSIDIDGCDLWVFYNLTKVYRPRVVMVESNPFFAADTAMTEKCGINGPEMPEVDIANNINSENGWSSWGFSEMGIYGASRKAFRLAARNRGYTPVVLDNGSCEDIFLLRDDLICDDVDSHQTLVNLRSNFENMPGLPRCRDWRVGQRVHDDDGKRLAPKYLLDFSRWAAEDATSR